MKVIITMPAYKAERTLERTVADIPSPATIGAEVEMLLVDDASPDNTVAVARRLGIPTLVHDQNRGYGGNQKTCYDEALRRGADVVVLLHPDYQYDPTRIPAMVKPILDGQADFTFGSRFIQGGNPRAGGMPLYRYLGNILTTWIENLFLGTRFAELHSGYKAYSAAFLRAIPYHTYTDDFAFDSQMIVDAVLAGFRIVEVPIRTNYHADASSVSVLKSLKYVGETVSLVAKARWGLFTGSRQRLAAPNANER